MFTPQELQVILQLISIAPIKGGDSITVGFLIQKINGILNAKNKKDEKEKKEKVDE